MGTAPKKSRAARQLARRAADANVPASMEFVIFADNGGSYHWRLRADDGPIPGDSGGFASYDDAEHAAQQVCGGAASAGPRPGPLMRGRLISVRAGMLQATTLMPSVGWMNAADPVPRR